MKTEDVISMALASGMYQDGEMFFSPSMGEADVHISDLEYFAKQVEERTLSKQKAGYYQEGYEAGQHDMFTKPQNVDTSAERVHESDKSIHEKTHTDHPMRHWDRTCPACVAEQEPVAWVRDLTSPQPHCVTSLKYLSIADTDAGVKYIPVYTAPPSKPWVSLTDEEVSQIYCDWLEYIKTKKDDNLRIFVLQVEAKLKEKNT